MGGKSDGDGNEKGIGAMAKVKAIPMAMVIATAMEKAKASRAMVQG